MDSMDEDNIEIFIYGFSDKPNISSDFQSLNLNSSKQNINVKKTLIDLTQIPEKQCDIISNYITNDSNNQPFICLKTIKSIKDNINCVIKLPNDNLALGLDSPSIKIINLNNDTVVSLDEHEDSILWLVNIPHRTIASSSADCTIKFWDIYTKKCTKTISLQQLASCLIKHPLNQQIICIEDTIIELWNFKGKCIKRIKIDTDTDYITTLENGNMILCDYNKDEKNYEKNTIKMVNIEGNTTIKVLEQVPVCVSMLQLDNNRIFCAFNEKIVIFNITNIPWTPIITNDISSLGYYLSEEYFLNIFFDKFFVASFQDYILFWDINTADLYYKMHLPFYPERPLLASLGSQFLFSDGFNDEDDLDFIDEFNPYDEDNFDEYDDEDYYEDIDELEEEIFFD